MKQLIYTIKNLNESQLETVKGLLDVFTSQGAHTLKNGSIELHIDDEGLVQELCLKKKYRRRSGEKLEVLPTKRGTVIASFDPNGDIGSLIVETRWIRKVALAQQG